MKPSHPSLNRYNALTIVSESHLNPIKGPNADVCDESPVFQRARVALFSTLFAAAIVGAVALPPCLPRPASGPISVMFREHGPARVRSLLENTKTPALHARFEGTTPEGVGMNLDGKCRVGLFSQNIKASIVKRGNSYRGTFLDGAKGKGLDIVSGSLRRNKLVVGINRKQLNGTMVANLKSKNKMHVTISVRANNRLVPVIGLTLNRSAKKAELSQ